MSGSRSASRCTWADWCHRVSQCETCHDGTATAAVHPLRQMVREGGANRVRNVKKSSNNGHCRLVKVVVQVPRRLVPLPPFALAHAAHLNDPVRQNCAEDHDETNLDHKPQPSAEVIGHLSALSTSTHGAVE